MGRPAFRTNYLENKLSRAIAASLCPLGDTNVGEGTLAQGGRAPMNAPWILALARPLPAMKLCEPSRENILKTLRARKKREGFALVRNTCTHFFLRKNKHGHQALRPGSAARDRCPAILPLS